MPKYRARLPQLDGELFLTDGGIETTLIFLDGFDLPHFAAFHLLRNEAGRQGLHDYFLRFASIATADGLGFVLESPTWRASPDWGRRLGYSDAALDAANHDAIKLMEEVRADFEAAGTPFVISGCVGPRGDGYDPGTVMTPDEAETYHAVQIGTFTDTEADMVTSITTTNTPEAIGIVRAARAAGLPAVISFTVETDGRLPTGQALGEAIGAVDDSTGGYAAYYMLNCAHPTHFADTLAQGGSWVQRLRGLRVNASRLSHAELDAAEELDDGDPAALAADHRDLLRAYPWINVLGGCCGTDHRHVAEISRACRKPA